MFMLFPSRGASMFGQDLDNARVQHSVKSPTAHPKDFQWMDSCRFMCENNSSGSHPTILSQFEPDEPWHLSM